MTTIIIKSEDGKEWDQFENFEWETINDAQSHIENINKEIKKYGFWESHQFEFVGKDFFEKYKMPYQ